jgi:two-component system nitrate/nitrite response regulator NarL
MASRLSPRMLAEAPSSVNRRAIRVLIALDSPMDCQLLLSASKRSRQLLNVVACAVSRTDILHCLSRGNVDVALINADLEDGRLAGLEILPEIQASYQTTPIVLLFDTWHDDLILHAFRAGAKGVFCRSEKNLDMLWKCINAVHHGQVWANSRQLQLLLSTLTKATPIRTASSPGMNLLATRETEVANLVAIGLPNKEIARRLSITEHTVSNYLFNIYNKLGISSRVELVLYIMKQREEHAAAAAG